MSLDVGRGFVPALVLGALAAQPGMAGEPSPAYAAAVARYAAGETREAVEQVASLSKADLQRALDAVRQAVREEERRCPGCPPPFPLGPALMLHTDRALADRAPGPRGGTCAGAVHASAAAQVAEIAARPALRVEAPLRTAVRGWAVAMALRGRADGCREDAERAVALGERLFARDPVFLFLRATLEEAAATRTAGADLDAIARAVQTQTWLTPAHTVKARVVHQHHAALEQAARLYEKAFAAEAGPLEAGVGLARLLTTLGRPEEARPVLRRVLERAPPPHLAYVAHLLLGRVGAPAEAEREFRAALATFPSAQTAAVALSHVLLRQGRHEEGAEVLRVALRAAPRTEGDPYWTYRVSAPGSGEPPDALLAALRREVLD